MGQESETSAELVAVHSRVLQHASKLFEALDDLAELGGLKALHGAMRPQAVERTVKVLESVRAAVNAQIPARGGR